MIDVSQFQGGIDWRIVPKQRVMVRMTFGASGVDTEAITNLHALNAGSWIYGGYHFLENQDPVVQIKHFLSVWHPVVGGLRGAIDTERSPFSTPTHNLVVSAVETYHSETGHFPIVYGNRGDLSGLALPEWFVKCPLWLADYGPDDGAEHPIGGPLPAPWSKVAAHQYTGKGRMPGINGNVDLSDLEIPASFAVPKPRLVIDYWRVNYVTRKGVHTYHNTRTPYAFAKLHRAERHGKVTIYPHRKER